MRLPLLLDLPGRDEAREAAQRELTRHEYRAAEPPWFVRLVRWLLAELDELLGRASAHVPGGGWGVLLLSLLVLGLVAVVLVRLRPAAQGTRGGLLFDGGQELTAQQHRDLAERAAARGDHADAVRERLRAVVRELEVRGIVEPRPGRTADEVTLEAGRALPGLAGALREGARVFDEIWYGGRPADSSSYGVLVALDERVVAARLVPA